MPNIPVNCIVIDSSNGRPYVGTDAAVFYLDSSNTWQLFSNNLPAAQVRDLGINYKTNEIWAATFGRGMWKSPKRDFTPAPTGISGTRLASEAIHVAPNPVSKGAFTISTKNTLLAGHEVMISIVDMSGRTVWKAAQTFNAAGSMNVNAGTLPRGQYSVQVSAANGLSAVSRIAVM